ncbi:ATP-binding cassette domain-containing protein [Enterococcus sp. LJL90]
MELLLVDISKNYDDQPVLKDITMRLSPGIYGFLGENGAGKTTLLQILTGLTKPSQGEVLYNSKNILENLAAFHSELGFLPQDFNYYPEFTGLKFMLYLAALKGLNKKVAKKRCLELLKWVGLSSMQNKKIKKYSGGMKQRLGIAQALINDPKVLVLDEPTVGLDPKERVKFRKLLSSFSQEKIVLLSTHIVSDIEYIADEIFILKAGQIANSGTAAELVASVDNFVWEVVVTPAELKNFIAKYPISNQKNEDGTIILRVLTTKAPATNAKPVQPTLEDLYLYYFREEQSDD